MIVFIIIHIVIIVLILIIKSFIPNNAQVVSEPADGRVVVKKGSSVTIKCLTRYLRIIMISMSKYKIRYIKYKI